VDAGPVLLTAIAVHAGSLVILRHATGVACAVTARWSRACPPARPWGADRAAMLDMDRELGTFAKRGAGMGSASGAILSALAVRSSCPTPTHLIYWP